MAGRNKLKGSREPVFVVRPAVKTLGFDNLHIVLMVLVVILVGVAFAISFFQQSTISKLSDCSYGLSAGACFYPQHNASQVLQAAGRVLAAYASMNTNASLLPYYARIDIANASYVPSGNYWIVIVPVRYPGINATPSITMLLSDKNLTLIGSYINYIRPFVSTSDTVLAPGVVSIADGATCTTTKPFPVTLFEDPYANGAMSSLAIALNASARLAGVINMSYMFIDTPQYADKFVYGAYGQETNLLNAYLACASKQAGFGGFVSNLSRVYYGIPLSNLTLTQVATNSGLSMPRLNSCLVNSSILLNNQELLALRYNITEEPIMVVDCAYTTLPETLGEAINYLNTTLALQR